MKPIFPKYLLHSLHGQFLGHHSFIAFLKILLDEMFFNLFGNICQTLAPEHAMLSDIS